MNTRIDKLPPTFVRDWWQLLHNKGYIILMGMVVLIALMVICSWDWAEIHRLMNEPRVLDYEYWTNPVRTVCREMSELNTFQAMCAMVLMALLIPLRVGNAVSADTRVKGTNFLQVTPLSSWQIVGGMWLSAFSQVLLAAAVAVPFLLARVHVMPMGYEEDWYGLGYLIMAGAVFSSAFMFISGLPQMLRYLLMALLIILGGGATMWATNDSGFCPSQIPLWLYGVHVLAAGLVTLLFLQLARRPYAAPAENTALPLRGAILACLAVGLLCWWGKCETYRCCEEDLVPAFGFEFPAFVLLIVGGAGALFDAVLPVTSLPVHAKRTIVTLPAWPQIPGVLQACFMLLLPAACLAILQYYPVDVCRSIEARQPIDSYGGLHAACIMASALVIWAPIVLAVCAGDFFVRRSSARRPLVILLSFMGIAIISALLSMNGDLGDFMPVINLETPWAAWRHFLGCIRHGEVSDMAHCLSSCQVCITAAVVEALIAAAAIIARVCTKRTSR